MGFFDKTEQEQPGAPVTSVDQELRRSKFFGWRDVIICLVIVGVFLLTKDFLGLPKDFLGFGDSFGGLKPVLEETQFGVTGLDGVTHTFVYAEADSIELHDDLKDFLAERKGSLVEGDETRTTLSGTYHNDEYGDYQLHVMTKLKTYILVRDANGVLIFNMESDDTTKELHRYCNELRDQQLGSAS